MRPPLRCHQPSATTNLKKAWFTLLLVMAAISLAIFGYHATVWG